MRPEWKKEWINELRSGTRRQISGYLQGLNPDDESDASVGFCCLGVLCETRSDVVTFDPRNGKYVFVYEPEAYSEEIQDEYGFDAREISMGTELDETVMHTFGLTVDQHATLIQMNDDEGKTFDEIADWIEVNL